MAGKHQGGAAVVRSWVSQQWESVGAKSRFGISQSQEAGPVAVKMVVCTVCTRQTMKKALVFRAMYVLVK